MSIEEKLELVVELVKAAKENLKEGDKLDSFEASFLELAIDLLGDIIFDYTVMI